MEKYVIFVLCAVFSTAVAPPPKTTKQYRQDYVYNKKTDAFYKLHIEKVRRWQVSGLCEVEGAQLMVPASDYDVMQLHGMFKNFPDLGDYVWVGDDGQTHESAEEQPIIDLRPQDSVDDVGKTTSRCDAVTRKGDIETVACYQELPFICKVTANDAPYDEECGVYARDYKYYSSVKSCYKIPRAPYTWSEAYSECQAEGAHLLVINSEAEHDAIFNLTNSVEMIRGSYGPAYLLAGFRADKPTGDNQRVFKTIFNQTLEEAGYSEWSYTEPNNLGGHENCGSVFMNDGKLNDVGCSDRYGFICEKEVPSIL